MGSEIGVGDGGAIMVTTIVMVLWFACSKFSTLDHSILFT
jgi:hypothetical protein